MTPMKTCLVGLALSVRLIIYVISERFPAVPKYDLNYGISQVTALKSIFVEVMKITLELEKTARKIGKDLALVAVGVAYKMALS